MSGTRVFDTVRLDLADIKETKTRLGGTVNDVVLALCAGGLRHLLLSRGDPLPEGDLRAQVPVNIRSQGKEHALGNELTSLFVELPLSEKDPIARYRRVVERAGAAQGRLPARRRQDDRRPRRHGAAARGRPPGAVDVRRHPDVQPDDHQRPRLPGAAVRARCATGRDPPLVPLFAGHTIGIAVVSYADQMVFGLNADRVAAPDIAILAEGIERSLVELGAP